MKRIILSSITILLLASATYVTGIYDISITKIEGGNQQLSVAQGRKLLVITLPVTQSAHADSVLHSLDTLAVNNAATLVVVAAPSYEDGYTAAQKETLKQWYRSKLGSNVIISEGLYSRHSSGTQQHPLFRWLTDGNLNESFDIDVTGPECKFFIRQNGMLYGVLGPQAKVWGNTVQQTLDMQ